MGRPTSWIALYALAVACALAVVVMTTGPSRTLAALAAAALVASAAVLVRMRRRLRAARNRMAEQVAEQRRAEAALRDEEGRLRDSEARLRQAEEHLRDANERLVESDRRKNEFLGVLSHELRNPLTPVRNSVQILERAAPGSEQARRAQAVIDRQITHLARLIDDLLDVTRISRGKIRLRPERVELRSLVRAVVEDLRSIFVVSGVELELVDSGEELVVQGDRTRLAQVLGNLLQNAAKFTPHGGHARVELGVDGSDALLRVTDDGAGIAPDMQPELFEPFKQAERTLDRTRGGLGLGLALVKALVELHGGSVAAHSEGVGKGSEFRVRLPVVERRLAAAESPVEVADGHRTKRILIIEDNIDAADTLKVALELGDHVVEVAHTGPEGLDKAQSFRPDIIICDIGLPLMDGYQVARAMRIDPELRSVPLIALTGYALPEDVQRAHEAGFDRHLAKPPDLFALERALAQVAAHQPAVTH